MDNNELSNEEMGNVSGGWGTYQEDGGRTFDVETCPKCSELILVFRRTRRGICKCGYVVQK